MNCPRCGSDDTHTFEPVPGAAPELVCWRCVGSVSPAVSLPPGVLAPHQFAERQAAYRDAGFERLPVLVLRACGHYQVMPIRLGSDEAVSTLGHHRCDDCVNAWRAEMTARSAAAAERAMDLGLPALQGSDRQVAWAESIRMDAVDRHGLDAVAEVVQAEVSAGWWIGNRARMRWLKVFREYQSTARSEGT